MAKYICPSCGSRFNGKKCSNCLYEAFDEEIAHRLHTHKGEPLVIAGSTRPSVPRKDPFGCENKTKKRRGIARWLVWLVVLSLLEPGAEMAGELLDSLFESPSASYETVEWGVPAPELPTLEQPELEATTPETAGEDLWESNAPVDLYQTGTLVEVYAGQGFTVYMGAPVEGVYPITVENTTGYDAILLSSQVVVDGFLSEQSVAYCNIPAGLTGEGGLVLDEADMDYAGIYIPGEVVMSFIICDLDTYENILEGEVTLRDGAALHGDAAAGDLLLDTDAVRIENLGYCPEGSSPDVFSDGCIVLYLENYTDGPLAVGAEDIRLNGKETNLTFWCELPGNTRTATRIWLYDVEDMNIQSPAQVEKIEMYLYSVNMAWDVEDLGWVTMKLS